jgi:hypothetical protein
MKEPLASSLPPFLGHSFLCNPFFFFLRYYISSYYSMNMDTRVHMNVLTLLSSLHFRNSI